MTSSPTLGARAYVELRDMLLQGTLEPGEQLVNRKLADAIGMSLTPVREAVARLASEGLVDHSPGEGAFVRRISWQEIQELFDVRDLIEPQATALAARYATPSEIADMRMAVVDSFRIIREIAKTKARAADEDLFARFNETDQRLHAIIYTASRNRWLTRIANELKLLSLWIGPGIRPALLTVPHCVGSWRSHRRLVRAIGRRDEESAAQAARQHISAARGTLRRLIENSRFPDRTATVSPGAKSGRGTTQTPAGRARSGRKSSRRAE